MNYYPKLKSLIDKIDELLKTPDLTADSKEFVEWQIRAELFLSRCYGQESTQMKRFQRTEFIPYFDFDTNRVMDDAVDVNPNVKIINVSSKTGEGLSELCEWFCSMVDNKTDR